MVTSMVTSVVYGCTSRLLSRGLGWPLERDLYPGLSQDFAVGAWPAPRVRPAPEPRPGGGGAPRRLTVSSRKTGRQRKHETKSTAPGACVRQNQEIQKAQTATGGAGTALPQSSRFCVCGRQEVCGRPGVSLLLAPPGASPPRTTHPGREERPGAPGRAGVQYIFAKFKKE